MRKMYVAFSHQLTKGQKEDAKLSLDVTEFVYPSRHVQGILSNIPDDMEPDMVRLLAWDIVDEAREAECDYIFIAGQVELVHYTLLRVKNNGYIQAVNSVTKRKSVEVEVNGQVTKTSVFEHVLWRDIL